MAWYYNQILSRLFKIGLVASARRHSSPAATMGNKFAFFLENSQISKIMHFKKRQKSHF
jgi:hypothetical protein